MVYSREQLIEAMQKYNSESTKAPDAFSPVDNSIECATEQIDYLLSFISANNPC